MKETKKKSFSAGFLFAAVGILCLIVAVALIFNQYANREKIDVNDYSHPAEVSHRVLFISSYNPLYYTYDKQAEGLALGLYPHGIEYDVVYMDSKRYSMRIDTVNFYRFLSSRLDEHDYEAVLIGDDAALSFALEYRDSLFPDLPVVFFGINEYGLAEKAASTPGFTGFYENNYMMDTLEIVDRLYPDDVTYVLLRDDSAAGLSDKEIFDEFKEANPGYEYMEINTMAMPQKRFLKYLETLPENAVVIYGTCYTDVEENTYSLLNRTNTILNHTDAPLFRNYNGGEGTGIVGGISMDVSVQCREAGETVNRILMGEDVDSIPLDVDTPSVSAFDYSVMKDRGLDMSILPADTVFYNEPETFMKRYGSILPAALLILFGMLCFIATANLSIMEAKKFNQEIVRSKNDIEASRIKLLYQAQHDEFLDIYNRRYATEVMKTYLKADSKYAIALADLDDFKGINETYGHEGADEILKMVGQRIKKRCEEKGWLLARFGGDEFLFMIPDKNLTESSPDSTEIMSFFLDPLRFREEILELSVSVGVSNSDGETSTDGHITFAEEAMYKAKRKGKNRLLVYDEDMKKKTEEENEVKKTLQEAFDNDGFFMVYQPKVNAKTCEVEGYEALIRMKAPGMYPGVFIPVAEKNGWIAHIGRITTELTVKQLAKWRSEGKTIHPVSVNFSSNQVNDAGYIEFLQNLLEKYELPAEYIEIEITEGLFLDKTAQAEDLFARFKNLGIKLLMDDFGTGYSSLGYLTYIPVDIIKLDKSLVDAYLVEGKYSFIEDVIKLVHDLDKLIIIEGVEEKWQYEKLREFKADSIQGYYFSKPLPENEAIEYVVEEGKR